MNVTINGEPRDLPGPMSVADYLNSLGLDIEHVAVEHNRAIVPRADFTAVRIAEGDHLEIIRFVGGG
ncbi:sulfur carrier protein ThiS [Geoalkalibacter halelectricus]|uniref:sulfur carrier protein ThiS n=1 Tax=Geoalkalibacter halelectricus TaxID=2847045 RepID=UPI003D1B088E